MLKKRRNGRVMAAPPPMRCWMFQPQPLAFVFAAIVVIRRIGAAIAGPLPKRGRPVEASPAARAAWSLPLRRRLVRGRLSTNGGWGGGVTIIPVPLTLAVANLLWKPTTAAITQTWPSFDAQYQAGNPPSHRQRVDGGTRDTPRGRRHFALRAGPARQGIALAQA